MKPTKVAAEALFIQPRHLYAPPQGLGHVYMPSAILLATSRVLQAGAAVTFQDENIEPVNVPETVTVVGMHTVGPSLLPSTLELQTKIEKHRPDIRFVQGGQIIDRLDRQPLACTPWEGKNFQRLFGKRAVNGNNLAMLAHELSIDAASVPAVEKTSLIPAYKLIDDSTMRLYLNNPFSLYVSQGCKFACNFCSARRSNTNTLEDSLEKVSESYRDISIIRQDVEYLIDRARTLGVHDMTMYLSNLDLAQTPEKIREFAEMMKGLRLKNPDVPIRLTGLATISEYKRLAQADPETLDTLREAGLTNIGFGVEGMAQDYWRTIRKGQNKEDDCYNMIADAVKRGLTPEILLTPGHEKDTAETLKTTLEYAEHMKEKYGSQIIIRPYCAKVWTTGSDGWYADKHRWQVEALLDDPSLFQSLEFNAEQTWFTAADPALLGEVNKVYRRLVELSEGAAPDLRAVTPGMTQRERERIRMHNMGKYDH